MCDTCKYQDLDGNKRPCCNCVKWIDGYLAYTKFEVIIKQNENKPFKLSNEQFKNNQILKTSELELMIKAIQEYSDNHNIDRNIRTHIIECLDYFISQSKF